MLKPCVSLNKQNRPRIDPITQPARVCCWFYLQATHLTQLRYTSWLMEGTKVVATKSSQKLRFAGVSSEVQALRSELAAGMREIASFDLDGQSVSVCAGRDAIWAIVRKPEIAGGVAIRAAHCSSGPTRIRRLRRQPGDTLRIEVATASGPLTICFSQARDELATLRVRTELTPSAPLPVPFLPRDLYPLGENDDPLLACGQVEAAQRGPNSGLVCFHFDEPAFGTVLYFQNFSALSDYFLATATKPDGAVGGAWPELGYLPPTSTVQPLPAWKTVVMSDAILVFDDAVAHDERGSALLFLQMLGAAYRLIDRPLTNYRDWVARAEQTLHNLQTAPGTAVPRHDHPYATDEYPDSVVKLSVLAGIHDYAASTGVPIPYQAELSAAMGGLHDAGLGMRQRYLTGGAAGGKDRDAVDSRNLYRPLLDLGRVALDGDDGCRRLFLDSLDYAIRAAHYFQYTWPTRFRLTDFDVVGPGNDDGQGHADVGGIYACIMLQAYDLTMEERFLAEARAAIAATRNMRSTLAYQANHAAWGASACMRLWRITEDSFYLRQSYVAVAAFFQNCAIWEFGTGLARPYSNFMSATCSRNDPDTALFECYDSFVAFERYLADSSPDLDPAVRMLICEYCKYALDRAWFYYPDAPSSTMPATDSHSNPKLAPPQHDARRHDEERVQVARGIGGSGAAFAFAARAFTQFEGAPFRIFCDHFLVRSERISAQAISLQLGGDAQMRAVFGLIRLERKSLPKFTVTTAAGEGIRSRHRSNDRMEYAAPADAWVTISWS